MKKKEMDKVMGEVVNKAANNQKNFGKSVRRMAGVFLAVATILSLVACGGTPPVENGGGSDEKGGAQGEQQEQQDKTELETTRMEAEYAKVENGRVDMKEGGAVSNDYFVIPTGGFKFEELNPINVTFDFEAEKGGEATITVAVMSSNTFGDEFELSDGDYLFYLNDEALGVPDSVVDYQGDPTTKVPKEDFVEGTGTVYFTYNVTLNEGANSFAWKYETGNGAFKLDYIEVSAKSGVTWTENMELVDAYDPDNFSFE